MSHVFIWNTQKTLLFLELYKKYKKQVGTIKIKNIKRMFQIIAEEMELQRGLKVLPSHCENRWKVLDRAYKKFIDNNNRTGCGRAYFEYAEAMEDIVGHKRNVKPVILLSSETLDPIREKETPTSVTKMKENCNPDNENIQNVPTTASVMDTVDVCRQKGKTRTYRIRQQKFEILKEIRNDRREYYKKRLLQEDKKIELEEKRLLHAERQIDQEERKISEKKRRNDLLEEKNQIIKDQVYGQELYASEN